MVMRNKILFIILSLGLLFGAGCATTSGRFPYQTVQIHNAAYFALAPMCDREGIRWDHDPLSQTIILKIRGKDMKLLIASKSFTIDGVFHELSGPVVLKDGVIYCPVDLKSYIDNPDVAALQIKPYDLSKRLRHVETVVLDAGHGGRDPGAIGKCGIKEKSIVIDVAKRIKRHLEDKGLKVYLTRDRDEFVPLLDRAKIANDKKADLFVSVHANANRSRWIEGFEVYYLTEAVDDNARALAAAENASLELDQGSLRYQLLSLKAIVWDMIYTENRKESIELARYISRAVSQKIDLKVLGVKGAPFAVLKGTRMPAVLVELGYISNADGEKKLTDAEYRERIAGAVASGIMDFKNYAEGRR